MMVTALILRLFVHPSTWHQIQRLSYQKLDTNLVDTERELSFCTLQPFVELDLHFETMSNKTDPCKKFACALQACLQANDFQEWKCQPVIEALYDCCAKCGTGQSEVCSGIHAKQAKGRISPLKFRHAAINIDGTEESTNPGKPDKPGKPATLIPPATSNAETARAADAAA